MTREAALLLFSSVRTDVSTIYRISFACTQGRIEFLAGPPNVRAGPVGWLLRVIAWSTLAIAPILLLLLFQLQFLPFHNGFIAWTIASFCSPI